MKHLNLAFAGVVAGSLALSAQAGTTEWWAEDFSGYSLDITQMTNRLVKAGIWATQEGDTSSLAGSYSNDCATAIAPTVPSDVLVLNTEGNELTFTPTNATTSADFTVVDADVFFVGSDTEPNLSDDTTVQFALFLKVPEDTGANGVSNSVMVYVNPDQEAAAWVALPNTNIGDKTWHHVQVKIKYDTDEGAYAHVFIDGTEKTPTGGYMIANGARTLTTISSVSFKGTGAVDNFAGSFADETKQTYTFTAAAYVDGVLNTSVEIDGSGAENIEVGEEAEFFVPRTFNNKPITNIVVKAQTGTDDVYAVADNGTTFTVTPDSLSCTPGTTSVSITIDTTDAATTGPALVVYYGDYTPPPAPTAFQKYFPEAQGSGTSSDPYQIPNLAALKALQAAVASNDVECIGAYYVQTADIALDAPWPGIGVQNGKDINSTADFNAAAFQGTFDGQNHTISGFQMIGKGDKAEGLDYCGFFNSTYGATIQNLKIAYAGSLFAADTTSSTKESGATFVGVAKNSTLRNLTTVAGTVSCSKGFGGIVGYLTSGTSVDSCTNNLNMTSLAGNKCGGIAMIAQGGSAVTISNCQNNGTQTTSSKNSEYGAIVGYVGLDITIANCETTVGRFLKHQGNTVTLQGVNKGDAGVPAYHGAATPGLNFATVDGNVATFVADDALALGNTYKVMGPSATATYEFTAAGSISFDTALATPTYAITAPGMILSPSTSDNVTTYTATAAAAKIGTTLYATFDAALAAAQADDTITLLANVALTSTVTVNKNLTIDLNGNNVTATDCRAFHVTAGAFELTGAGTVSTVVTQGTSMDSNSSVIRVGSNTAATSFTLGEGVTVSSDYCYGVTYFGGQQQTVVLNGTVAVTGAQAAISGNGLSNGATTLTVGENATISATQDYAIYNPQPGTTTINGTVTGLGGVEVKAGTVTVGSTAKITATGTPSYSQPNQNGTSTSGYAIAAVGNSAYQQPAAAVVEAGAMVTGTVIVLEENNSTTYGSITSNAELNAPTGYLWVAGEEAGTVELVKAFTVTFTTDHGTAPAAQTVANGAVAKEPTAPEATGWTFKGWTLGGSDYSFSTPVTADITLVAAWEENAQPVKPQVNPGDNLPAGTAPMSFGADGKCTVRFVAPAAGTYVLLSSTTVDAADEAWTADGTSVTVEAGATVELTEGTSAPAKFFKIGWEK